ncbi:MAG: hypothetical protein ACO1OB_00565 [Archangium sp.]
MSFWKTWAKDRWLRGATLVLAAACLFPLTQTAFVPLTDLPNHVALASVIGDLFGHDALTVHHFMLQPRPSPYWLFYLAILLPSYVLAPQLAAKLVVALGLVLIPLGVMRLRFALGRSPWLGLWAFAASWEFSFNMGFVAFSLATGFSLFFLARVVEQRSGWRQHAVTVALGLLVSASHAHAAGVASVLAFALALAELPKWKNGLRVAGYALVPVLGLLPWVLLGPRGERAPMPPQIAVFPSLDVRLSSMFDLSLGLSAEPLSKNVLAVCFVVLLLGPLLLLGASRSGGADLRRPIALYAAAWVLFAAMPSELRWPFAQLLIYERHATLILLMGLLLPSAEFSGAQRWLLAPGLAASLLVAGCATYLCRTYGEATAPFVQIIDAVKPHSRVAALLFSHRTEASLRDTLSQLPAYIVANKGGYYPHLFQTPNLPARYIESAHLPSPPWNRPTALDASAWAFAYDYVLVQGKANDPLHAGVYQGPRPFRLDVAADAGMWRLYSVTMLAQPSASAP